MSSQSFYAHGKLMLTGEYAVLDGAKSLAIPCKFGQKLLVKTLEKSAHQIQWKGFNEKEELWINAKLPNNSLQRPEHIRLQQILKALEQLNAELFYQNNFEIQTFLEFPR